MKARLTLVVAALTLGALSLRAQGGRPRPRPYGYDMRGMGGDYYTPPDFAGNPFYDGRVTFVRIRYRGYEHFTNQGPGWSHDYPVSETHFAKIMREITTTRPFVESGSIFGSAIINMDDPALFKYPVAYLSEPGGWHMTESELKGFKKYIERGGFMIFDDMGSTNTGDIMNLNYEWTRAFPKAKLQLIPPSHPVFDSFFKIDLTKVTAYYGRGAPAQIYGYFEDNDPKKRLLGVVNDMQDLGEFIEFSDKGFDVVPSNEAYKLLINYFVYALSH